MRADEAGCAGDEHGGAGTGAGARRRQDPLFPPLPAVPEETPVVVGQQQVVAYEAQEHNEE